MEVTQVDDKDVKGIEKTHQKRFENDIAHLYPSRWWFASSAFPMIAGTLGPVASAFSICALARPWRQHIPPGTSITDAPFVDDPIWLTVINAVQLVVAVISNLFLLMNMARRIRFSIAQPVTIVGWYISSILLLSLNATASGPLAMVPPEHYVLSQAYYYGIFAAVLYFVVASLMVVTIWGALAKHYSSDFQLTSSQRTLMLQTIMYLNYLLLGALVFSVLEGWTYLDAVYWANTTLFTIGYGDLFSVTGAGRALLIPFTLCGIINLGLLIASIRSLMLDRSLRSLDARMTEKYRLSRIRHMIKSGKDAILQPILSRHGPNNTETDPTVPTVPTHHPHHHQPNGPPNDDGTKGNDSLDPSPSPLPKTEYERRKHEFLLMRRIQRRASHRRRWLAMFVSFTAWLLLWLLGAKIFQETEKHYQGWSYFDGFYFAFVTLTTVGYGDLTPVSPAGRAFSVFWSLLALPTTTVMISNAEDTVVLAIKTATIDLGNITILPGEHRVRYELKRILSKLSGGALFPRPAEEDEEECVDGENEKEDDNEKKVTADSRRTDLESLAPGSSTADPMPPSSSDAHHQATSALAAGISSSSAATPSPSRRPSFSKRDPTAPLPSSPADYHYLLIAEIAAVLRDTRRKTPKRYTFAEWAWYLKLLGEDEAKPHTHRKATAHPHDIRGGGLASLRLLDWFRPSRHGDQTAVHQRGDGGQGSQNQSQVLIQNRHGEGTSPPDDRAGRSVNEADKWSWVGHQSPLLGSEEESQWILDKLTEKLRLELEKERHPRDQP
ncbi:voltage-gated potassium channel [Sodiomyces alkalinus F11]|uniref:Voltage-gated potassium channel n=1 Tax=Sodiomyces alkalinus (strain CBS 110278 / VKM F-3762 / F11) TaxID=1314773 RepID=A0A3N2PPY0_SODAK|nr:voltage-gated potassium channel [Sodiomyces alkalinus F11]ROT36504.1 voltage-gated potassium channel [Sodiomyces alkalinus F11]